MTLVDYIVLFLYFAGMAGIGFWALRRVKKQEDFFMGGRSFGKFFQTFAAFGAGTGSADPVNTARGTFVSGMSGMWGVMYWLFVTPVYWISGVWYRRMRCLTLGDWFVERYESKGIGVAYAIFGVFYYMVYGGMLFAALGKVAAPLMGGSVQFLGSELAVESILIPVIAVIVTLYGVLGGLTAAYWTDVIQGICIILLSVLLIPFGLAAMVSQFGGNGLMDGFRIMHEQLPAEYFTIIGSGNASEFPLHAILAITIINMIGIVVTPHFIATGGGSAKSEMAARVGLVAGNFIKRFCTIGWVLTALIVLTLYADDLSLLNDPDKTWGYATLKLLGPMGIGLVGLMLACLLAALMSSVDCYMLVCAALVVRNVYVPYFNPQASDKNCIRLGRIVGAIVVIGAVVLALAYNDLFKILKLTWIVPMTFAAPFWIGMYWRRATTGAAWGTVLFCLFTFFLLPKLIPMVAPGMRDNPNYALTNPLVETTSSRTVAPSDIARRNAEIEAWEVIQSVPVAGRSNKPVALKAGDTITETSATGGKAIFWTGGVSTVGNKILKEISSTEENGVTVVTRVYDCKLRGNGDFRIDLLVYHSFGINLVAVSSATLSTLDLPFKILAPFIVLIVLSFLTPKNNKATLDRFYVKMKTPVDPEPDKDVVEMEKSYAQPDRFNGRKWINHPDLEIQRPTKLDFWGFLACFGFCFLIISLVFLIATIGA